MFASGAHSSASMDKLVFQDGGTEDSMVASKIVLLMWSTGTILQDRLVDQLSTMEQRFHANLVLPAKGRLQYRRVGSNLKEQYVTKKFQIKFHAHIAVEN